MCFAYICQEGYDAGHHMAVGGSSPVGDGGSAGCGRVVVAPGGTSPAGDRGVMGSAAPTPKCGGIPPHPPPPLVVVAPARLEAHAVRFSRRGALLLFKTDKSLSVLTRTSLRGSEV